MKKVFFSAVLMVGVGLVLGMSQKAIASSGFESEVLETIFEPQRRGLSCKARDRGHEEHWGGHGSCRSCLRKHGSCIESCYERFYVCRASGTDEKGEIRRGFRGRGQRQWRAEERALRRCERAGYDYCEIEDCDSKNELVSRHSC